MRGKGVGVPTAHFSVWSSDLAEIGGPCGSPRVASGAALLTEAEPDWSHH